MMASRPGTSLTCLFLHLQCCASDQAQCQHPDLCGPLVNGCLSIGRATALKLTEILLNTLRAAPLTLSTPPVFDAEAAPVGAAMPLILAWSMVMCPNSEVVVMDQLMLEDGEGGVCVSTTRSVGVPETSETSDGMMAVGRVVVAAATRLAVVGLAAARCAVVVMVGLLSPAKVISWPGGIIESMSWARAMEPANASTRIREAMVDEDGLVSVLAVNNRSTRRTSFVGCYGKWRVVARFNKICRARLWLNVLPRRSRTAGCPWLKKEPGEQKEGREEEPVTAAMMSSENRGCVPACLYPLAVLASPQCQRPAPAETANDARLRGEWPANMGTQTKNMYKHQAVVRERVGARVSITGGTEEATTTRGKVSWYEGAQVKVHRTKDKR